MPQVCRWPQFFRLHCVRRNGQKPLQTLEVIEKLSNDEQPWRLQLEWSIPRFIKVTINSSSRISSSGLEMMRRSLLDNTIRGEGGPAWVLKVLVNCNTSAAVVGPSNLQGTSHNLYTRACSLLAVLNLRTDRLTNVMEKVRVPRRNKYGGHFCNYENQQCSEVHAKLNICSKYENTLLCAWILWQTVILYGHTKSNYIIAWIVQMYVTSPS